MKYIDQKDEDYRPVASWEERERIPQGIYDVMVMEAKQDQVRNGKNAGQDKIRVAMRIQKGEHTGRWIWDNVLQWKVKSFILSTGCKLPNDGAQLNLKEYEGKWARVSITWKNEWNNVSWLSDDEPLKKYPKNNWAKKKAIEKSQPAPEPPDDDIDSEEVPF